MTFEDLLDHAMALLQRRSRVSYRVLTRQFALTHNDLDDLTEAMRFADPQIRDEDGRGLIWTAQPPPPAADIPRVADAARRFHVLLPGVIAFLRQEQRVTYCTLTDVFSLDETLLHGIREELVLRRLAIDEGGRVLRWTGKTAPTALSSATAIQSVTPETDAVFPTAGSSLRSPVTEAETPSPGPTVPHQTISTSPPNQTAMAPKPQHNVSEAERRQLTVMFCDLVGSTTLSQQLDPEDLRQVVHAYQKIAAEVIVRYEGHIAQYLGDGLLVYFGWPQAHEDDAQRAVHTGLGILEALATLNSRLETDYRVKLGVRVGIHTGPVVVGAIGSNGRREHLALGETPNIAARLEGFADSDTVVISNVTARLLQQTFALQELGEHQLKGLTEPIQLFRVIASQEELDGTEPRIAGNVNLVGRDEEIGLLRRRWEQSKEGQGQVVLIAGEAGIGKSILVDVIRTHVDQENSRQITFRSSQYHCNSTLYPVIMRIERLLEFAHEETPEGKLRKIEQAFQTHTLPQQEIVPLIAALLSVPVSEQRYAALSLPPQQKWQHIQDTLVAWLLEESERQPLLVVWEDLHWADPSTLELLGLCIDQAPTATMLHVLTFRPEFTPSWPQRSHTTPLTLNRLERLQVEALIRQLAGDLSLPTEVLEHIVTKADGVPLYVEELTKMLLESNLLCKEGGSYELTRPLGTMPIPDTLQDSLMARLDQLHTAKEVAQLGAVLGREFFYEVVQALVPQDAATLQAGLAQLVKAELLYQRGRPPRARYFFKHALIRDAAYASLLKSRRQQVHQQVARLFEARYPEIVESQPELIAYHYTEAALPEQAGHYWQQAGQRAAERSAHLEAIEHLTKGLDVLRTLPDTPDRAHNELTLLTSLGSSLIATQGNGATEVEPVYIRAMALCQHIGEPTQYFTAMRGLWNYYLLRANLSRAQELGTQLLSLAQQQQDPGVLLAAYRAAGTTAFWAGEIAMAQSYCTQGRQLYHRQQHRDYVALYGEDPDVYCRVYEALALWLLGYPDQALHQYNTAIKLAHELSHPFSQAITLTWATWLHTFRGDDVALIRDRTEAALIICRAQGFAFWTAQASIMQGSVLAMAGQTEDGLAQMRQGLAANRATGAWLVSPYFLALQAEILILLGDTEEADAVLREGLSLIEQNHERVWEAELHRLSGELRLRQIPPNMQQAEISFQQALDVSRHQHAKSLELRAATSLARLRQAQGKRQEAYDLLAPVYEWFTEGFDTADLKDAKALLQELA